MSRYRPGKWDYYWNAEVIVIIHRIADEMGIRVNNRQPHEVLADIERYIQCARYRPQQNGLPYNPIGKLTTWP